MPSFNAYKKKDGKTYWEFRATLGYDKHGNPKQIRRMGFETKKDAQLAFYKLGQDNIEKIIEGQKTFKEVYQEWVKLYIQDVRESTARGTISKYNNYFLPKFGNEYMCDISRAMLQKAFDNWTGKFKKIAKLKSSLNMLFKYAMRYEYISTNPLDYVEVKSKSNDSDKDNFYDKHELQEFIEALERYADPMWRAFFYILIYTGMRRGEALALNWSDIDFDKKTITINKSLSKSEIGVKLEKTKTSNGMRTISASDVLLQKLIDYKQFLKNNEGILFKNTKGTYITLSQPGRQLERIIKLGNLKPISPHGFRHTHCSLLFEAGGSIAQVQQRLGHSDIKVTLGVYNHITRQKLDESADLFSNYIR